MTSIALDTVECRALPPSPVRVFSTRLESLRGLAALAVALYHSVSVFEAEPQWQSLNRALQLIGSGGGPVFLFFVLSGYVLALSLRDDLLQPDNKQIARSIASYYFRRAARLFPLLFFVIGISFVLQWQTPAPLQDDLTPFAKAVMVPVHGVRELTKNILLFSSSIVPVAWTLRIELFWSILLPAIVASQIFLSRNYGLLLLVGLVAAQVFFQPGYSIHYGFAFYLGAALIHARHARYPGFIALIGLAMIWVVPLLSDDRTVKDLVFAVASGAIVFGVVNARTKMSFLEWSPVRFLGRISYSFYLWHWIVLFELTVVIRHVFPELTGIFGNVVLFGVLISVTVLISSFTYQFIEVPCMNFARKLSKTHQAIARGRL